jgi:flagellar biosynthesis GTPase FlhF
MITRIFISLSLIISFQTYAGPFDDLQKGLGAMKELEGMMNKKEEKKDEKTIEQANEPVIEDPAVAEAKRKEEEKRKEQERIAREEQRKKEEQERIAREKKEEEQRLARQAEREKRKKREAVENNLAMMVAADRCRDEFQISQDVKNTVKPYMRDEINEAIEKGNVSKDWVNDRLKLWRVQISQGTIYDILEICQALETVSAAIKAETTQDDDAF